MRVRGRVGLLVALVLPGLLGAASAAGAVEVTGATFSELTGGVAPGFSANSGPSGAALGPDGNVWFAQQSDPGRIGRVTPSGAVTQLTGGATPGLQANARPANVTGGPALHRAGVRHGGRRRRDPDPVLADADGHDRTCGRRGR